MTEAEWRTCGHPAAMLKFLEHRVPKRKILLFAASCVEQLVLRSPAKHLALVEAVRQFAKGGVGFAQLESALKLVKVRKKNAYRDTSEGYVRWALTFPEVQEDAAEVWSANRPQCDLLRCIVGNPHRVVRLQPDELLSAESRAIRIAQRIVDKRTFESLPILADALEDAGCSIGAILKHCRDDRVHTPGCWVLDAILNYPKQRRSLAETWTFLEAEGVSMRRNPAGEPLLSKKMPHPDDEEIASTLDYFRCGVEDRDLSNLTIPRTFFLRSSIERVRFVNTDLSGSWMCWNDFIDCDFSGADLSRCQMRASVFTRCRFVEATLSRADLRRSAFEDCDFTMARMNSAKADEDYADSYDLNYELSEKQHDSMIWFDDPGPEPEGG
jgi:BTB/POZ domain-containing protein KCTD9